MAQLDARPTGDQKAAGSTNILSWRFDREIILRSFSSFFWFKKGSCLFMAKECAQFLLTA